jgi:hypothetical protein
MKTWRIMLVVLVALALAGSAGAITIRKSTDAKLIGGANDPAGKAGIIYPPVFANSPGESLDFSWYDFQANGTMSRQIALDHGSPRGLHVIYMKSPNSTHTPRNAAYQFNDRAGGGWTGELDANTARAGYMTLALMPDGRAVAAFHQAGGAGNRAVVAVDAARGAGAFTVTSIDTASYPPGAANVPIWPHVAVDNANNIQTVSHHWQNQSQDEYSRSTNGGTSFSPFRHVMSDTNQNPISADMIVSRTSGKVAIAWTRFVAGGLHRQWDMDIVYVQSTDYGATWGSMVNVTNYQSSDTVRAYNTVSGIYDNSDNLNLVWDGHLLTGGAGYVAAAIFHWSAATGIDVMSGPGMISGTYWWNNTATPAVWSNDVTRPSLSIDTTGNLYCVFAGQRNDDDSSAAGFINMDLYGTGSADGGNTWSPVFNFTNSHTPGGQAGQCDDDEFPTLTAFTPDSVRVLWIVDRDAGSSVNSPAQGATTLNPMHYLGLAKSLFLGVEGQPPSVKMPGSFELSAARPNPLGRMTEISYALPVARTVNLAVYNTAGQLVRTLVTGRKEAGYHSARLDAGSLPAGVYLYRLSAGEFTQTRSMVVVR